KGRHSAPLYPAAPFGPRDSAPLYPAALFPGGDALEHQVAERHRWLFGLELVRPLVVLLEARIFVVLVVRVLVGCDDLKHVVLVPIRLQSAVTAADQASLQKTPSPGVVLPSLELVAFEQRLKVLGAVRGDVQDDGGVLASHAVSVATVTIPRESL